MTTTFQVSWLSRAAFTGCFWSYTLGLIHACCHLHRQVPHRRPDCTPRGESERATLGHEAVPHERRHHHPPRRRLRRSLRRHLRHDHATMRGGISRLSAWARMGCSSEFRLQFALEPPFRLRAQAPPPPPDFPRVRRRHSSALSLRYLFPPTSDIPRSRVVRTLPRLSRQKLPNRSPSSSPRPASLSASPLPDPSLRDLILDQVPV